MKSCIEDAKAHPYKSICNPRFLNHATICQYIIKTPESRDGNFFKKISSQIVGTFTHNLPKIWAHPIIQNLHLELLVAFPEARGRDSVMMLASTQQTWLILAFTTSFWCSDCGA
jgi:hypothetical protein